MKQRASLQIFAAVCALAWPATLRAESDGSIPGDVRAYGAFERIIVSTDKPYRLADLAGAADLIVEGSPIAERSYLDSTGTHIYTDYAFAVQSILKNRWEPGLRPSRTVVIRREMGTVMVDGVAATTVENGFAPFVRNGTYFLFLKELPSGGGYGVIAGGQGAFEAAAEMVPMAPLPGDGSTHPVPREAFLGEVRALLKFTQ